MQTETKDDAISRFLQGLRELGVKSVTIEFHAQRTVDVFAPPPEPGPATKSEPTRTPSATKPEPAAKAEPAPETQQPPQAETPPVWMPEQPPQAEKPDDEKPAKKASKKKAPVPEPADEKPAAAQVPADAYETLVSLVEQDDGSETSTAKVHAAIGALKHDDMLRVNNSFALGLDTDCPEHVLREQIKACF